MAVAQLADVQHALGPPLRSARARNDQMLRQTEITEELLDVVSGFEVLRTG